MKHDMSNGLASISKDNGSHSHPKKEVMIYSYFLVQLPFKPDYFIFLHLYKKYTLLA